MRFPSPSGLLLLSLLSTPVLAQPANDNIGSAEVITTVPFTDVETAIAQATSASTDPVIPCTLETTTSAGVLKGTHTVWYRFTPATTDYYFLGSVGSDYDTIVAIWTGDSETALSPVVGGCNDDSGGDLQSRIHGAQLEAARTYWIEVSDFRNAPTASLQFSLDVSLPRYQVTKTDDTADGACDADCSLREAVSAANASAGIIFVPAGEYQLTIAGAPDSNNATGDLDVDNGMSIIGAGAGATGTRIVSQTSDRVLQLVGEDSLLLRDVSVTGGNGLNGGGILANTGSITLDRVRLHGNNASGSGGGMSLTNSTCFIHESEVSGNVAFGNGGGVFLTGRQCEVRNSVVSGNSTIDAAFFGGGGIRSLMGWMRVVNSTVSGNSTRRFGGGVQASGGVLEVSSSTIAGNRSRAGNAIEGGGVYYTADTIVRLRNSVAANNTAGADGAEQLSDCDSSAQGPSTSSYLLVESPRPNCVLTGPGVITDGTDPNLAPAPADNGGPTQTIALNAPSAAIDGGDPVGCVDPNGFPLAHDQRGTGFPRRVGTRCDIGAVEGPSDVLLLDGFED